MIPFDQMTDTALGRFLYILLIMAKISGYNSWYNLVSFDLWLLLAAVAEF
jgi:hypothetical protein